MMSKREDNENNLDIEMYEHRLRRASHITELSAEEADISFDADGFDFRTTAELEPLDEIVGQPRAMSALELGLGIRKDGYNIFAAGLTGTGKKEMIKRSLKKRLTDGTVPDDWVYVHNFDNSDEPWAINLRVGKGRQLKKDMCQLVERLQEALPKAFRQQDFSKEKEQLSRRYEEQLEQDMDALRDKAKEQGFELGFSAEGRVSIVPYVDDKPAENREQIEQLSEDDKKRISEGEKELTHQVSDLMQKQRRLMQNLTEEIREIEQQFAGQVVGPMIESIKESYKEQPRVGEYLERVGRNILDNLSDFHQRRDSRKVPAQLQEMMGEDSQPRFLEYQVNVVIDNSRAETAPIVVEDAPTYRNLFGSIDRTTDRRGRLVTNFTQIKAGSMLRANGGYLVFDIEDALTEPFVYKNLKRTLKSGCIQLESYNPWLPFSTGGLRPEPITVTTKVVVVGRPLVYYLLRFYDDEFASVFKIKADFGTEMSRQATEQTQYARFVAGQVEQEQLRHFTVDAVKEIVRFGSRKAGDKQKLLTRFSEVADLIREAGFFAENRSVEEVHAADVQQALDNRVFRSNRIAERIRELIREGTLLVDTDGSKAGQVNGLAIINLGDYAFGRPNRVTASVGLGTDGLVNIEREAKLSGSTHDKGVLILAGFLRNKYGRRRPVTLSAGICLEQSYSGVEGDSASSAELLALLSNLADVPVRQDIAVTGSVNQWGEIQAIGGVNEKIEGFFDVCREVGLTGEQGVCIPKSNIKNVILRGDVCAAITNGMFHVYPVESIDESLELLTGFQAGSPDEEDCLHGRIADRLKVMAETLRDFGGEHHTKLVPAEAGVQEPPVPPRIPGDQP